MPAFFFGGRKVECLRGKTDELFPLFFVCRQAIQLSKMGHRRFSLRKGGIARALPDTDSCPLCLCYVKMYIWADRPLYIEHIHKDDRSQSQTDFQGLNNIHPAVFGTDMFFHLHLFLDRASHSLWCTELHTDLSFQILHRQNGPLMNEFHPRKIQRSTSHHI